MSTLDLALHFVGLLAYFVAMIRALAILEFMENKQCPEIWEEFSKRTEIYDEIVQFYKRQSIFAGLVFNSIAFSFFIGTSTVTAVIAIVAFFVMPRSKEKDELIRAAVKYTFAKNVGSKK